MEVEGRHSIKAPRTAVEATIQDMEALQTIIPGCEGLEYVDDGSVKAVVAVDTGSFQARFTGTISIKPADTAAGWVVTGQGRGHPAGSAKGEIVVIPSEDAGSTVLGYSGTIEVGGKFASVSEAELAAYGRDASARFFAALEAAARSRADWVDQPDHSMAGVQLGDEPSEDVVVDKPGNAGHFAESIEEQVELAAGRSYLGGPYVWGLIVLAIVVLAFLIF